MKLSQFALLVLLAARPAFAADPSIRALEPRLGVHTLAAGAEVVLNIRHEGLPSEGRREAGGLVQGMVQQMVEGGYTVCFAREFVEAEVAYYRTNLSREKSRTAGEAVLGCLERALQEGQFDWVRLGEILRATPDSDTVTRNLPWLHAVRDPHQLRLAPAATNDVLPVIELAIRWEGRRVKGVIVGMGEKRSGLGVRFDPTIATGESWLWRIAGTLTLRRGPRQLAAHTYPEQPWRPHYRHFEETPFAQTQEKILTELKSALKFVPPFPSEPPSDKRKRK